MIAKLKNDIALSDKCYVMVYDERLAQKADAFKQTNNSLKYQRLYYEYYHLYLSADKVTATALNTKLFNATASIIMSNMFTIESNKL